MLSLSLSLSPFLFPHIYTAQNYMFTATLDEEKPSVGHIPNCSGKVTVFIEHCSCTHDISVLDDKYQSVLDDKYWCVLSIHWMG